MTPANPMQRQSIVGFMIRSLLMASVCYMAWSIRLNAVRIYGRVIHEFDPWFNFRATEYLAENGWEKFSTWFDDMVWYPLGRPVGSTTYPGLQLTAAYIYWASEYFGIGWTLNDICVFIPAGFGALACIACAGLATEVSGSYNAGVISAALFAILPGHLMRSVAGGYDNESIAVTAIVLTFYFWVRALRDETSYIIFAPLSALAYIYMVIAWGGYTFVLNMVGVHVFVLVLAGRHSSRLHRAYSVWFLLGTWGAMQFQIVGWKPLQEMEQIGPLGVFLVLQLVEVLEYFRRKHKMDEEAFRSFRLKVLAVVVVLSAIGLGMVPHGYFGPVSNRVKSLFIKHTHTGNPLVDSVAEHQATKPDAYWLYFHLVIYLAPLGLVPCFFRLTDSKYFLVLYLCMTAYFSRKMVRLILLLAPAASISAGVVLTIILEWAIRNIFHSDTEEVEEEAEEEAEKSATSTPLGKKGTKNEVKPSKKNKDAKRSKEEKFREHHISAQFLKAKKIFSSLYASQKLLRTLLAVLTLVTVSVGLFRYYNHCQMMSNNLSEPQIILRGRSRDGGSVIIDDFREGYWWLRDNTPEDSRVMAWWDYGYQITGVGNRTTIADGNTWNHEHLALLGKCLVSEEEKSFKITRHLADYVLVWSTRYAGMYGDDLAKVPHIARIAGSVYSDVHGDGYYMQSQTEASPLLRESLIYRLHGWRLNPQVQPLKHFEEVHTTKNMMMRIYKVKNVAERAPHGDYSPWVKKNVVSKMKAYNQKK
eukprot:CAMPEP_0196575794 /NCGR_PEP_ID=MMETSP1081-20130531/5195_1 /TAXON_ID=36882 /ORGANISM="Pyramimonas amylifera, Strain CCMP720" /LENGTH=755 /DNA_ID=CAMNT_0041894201 /DNA_START=187 /DNA_END=2454 /DNA_ORIENTATION=-